jgi:hypothetical protein
MSQGYWNKTKPVTELPTRLAQLLSAESESRDAEIRLIVAARNAFIATATTLGIDDVCAFAERMENGGIADLVNAARDAEQEISTMLEDLCDEPEEDISAHRTLASIRTSLALVDK